MNEGLITIDPIAPWPIIALSFTIITASFLWMEWRRKLRFRWLRLGAVVIMMLMLAGLLLRPYASISRPASILLLTAGYDTQQVDSLVTVHNTLRIMHAPGASNYKKSIPIASFNEIPELEKNIAFIAGEGLPSYVLDGLNTNNFTFMQGKPPEGIIELTIAEKIAMNQRSEVSGLFRNRSGARSIFLVGPGGKEDSVTLGKNGTLPFSLSFIPRQTGKLLYSLVITDSVGNSQQERLPITVSDPSPLKVLVVSSFPTFEITFLKNFVASKGNELVLRSKLSKSNFSYEYVNHAPVRFSALNKTLLDEFDILVTDRHSLQQLSARETTALKQAISNGLGLLSLYDLAPKEKDQSNFFPFKTVTVKDDTTTLSSGPKKFILPALPFRVIRQTPLQPVLRNESGILSGYTFQGAGKIGFQLLQETYRLVLAGDTLAYGHVWVPLLERIARTPKQTASIEISSPFPYYADEPLRLRLISSVDAPSLLADSIRIPLREDVQLDNVWSAKVWAPGPGWHTFQVDGESMEFFVSNADEWQTLAKENQIKQNQQAASASQSDGGPFIERRKISPVVFFISFLIAAGFLWLAPKL